MKAKLIMYSKLEELFNYTTHFAGFLFFIIYYLHYPFNHQRSRINIVATTIYVISLSLMFFSSALYHFVSEFKVKSLLRLIDHASIFICIAGSYTPIILLKLSGKSRIMYLSIILTLAISGMIHLFASSKNLDKNNKISIAIYLFMGWFALFLVKTILDKIGLAFFIYIFLGGVFYSVGIIFYKLKNLKFNHAIWHIFVLVASLIQLYAIDRYVINSISQ